MIHIMYNLNEYTELVMSSVDIDRIRTAMVSGLSSGPLTLLQEEIGRAQVLPQTAIPPDIVTMNSRVKILDASSGQIKELTLVYPKDANPDAGRVSVLAPIGSALLGLRIGQTIDWPLPGGRIKRITPVELCYQPESAGDFHL
jgi:regulator of nucleoside diphosphate kinase